MQGFSRTYIYELLDWNKAGVVDDMNMHYGLIRADGSAKPSFRALKNLLSIVKEEEVSYELSPLKFGIDPRLRILNIHCFKSKMAVIGWHCSAK